MDPVKSKRIKVAAALAAGGIGAYLLSGSKRPQKPGGPPPHDLVAPVPETTPFNVAAILEAGTGGRTLSEASIAATASPFSWAVVEATIPAQPKIYVPGAVFETGPIKPTSLWSLKRWAERCVWGGQSWDPPNWFWRQQLDRIMAGKKWLLAARDQRLYSEASGSFMAGGGGGGKLGRIDPNYRTARQMWPAPRGYMEKKAAFLAVAREGVGRGFYPRWGNFEGVGEALTGILLTEVSPYAGGYANHRVVPDPEKRYKNELMWVPTNELVPPEESVDWRYRRLNGFAHRMLAWWEGIRLSKCAEASPTCNPMSFAKRYIEKMRGELAYIHTAYGGFESPKNEILNIRLAILLGKWGIDHARTLKIDWDPDEALEMLVASFIVGLIAVAIEVFLGIDIKDYGVNYDEWFEDSLSRIDHAFADDPYLAAFTSDKLEAQLREATLAEERSRAGAYG